VSVRDEREYVRGRVTAETDDECVRTDEHAYPYSLVTLSDEHLALLSLFGVDLSLLSAIVAQEPT